MLTGPEKSVDVAVYIGRFQPFHNGHLSAIEQALSQAEKLIIILGGHDEPRKLRSPFTTNERLEMIRGALSTEQLQRVRFGFALDYTYNNTQWVTQIREIVAASVARMGWQDKPRSIGILSNPSDNSSTYGVDFPEWQAITITEESGTWHATQIRNAMIWQNRITFQAPHEVLPRSSVEVCTHAMGKKEFQFLLKENEEIQKYNRPYKHLPYPPIFQTVDAVVIQSGHVLLVQRGGVIGKGKLALPGGFLNADETLLDAVVRELKEETRLNVPTPVLKGSISKIRTFDDPYRSQLARLLTTAYLIELRSQPRLHRVQGADDAEKAFWVPLADLRRDNMHDDHFHIIQKMIG